MAWIPAVQGLTVRRGSFSIWRRVDNISVVFTATEWDIQVSLWNLGIQDDLSHE